MTATHDLNTRSLSPKPPASQDLFVFIMAQQPQAKGYEHEDAWDTNWLRVDETHEIYYEQYGLKDGKSGIHTFTALSVLLSNFWPQSSTFMEYVD